MTACSMPCGFGLKFGKKGLGKFVCVALRSAMHSINAAAAQMMIEFVKNNKWVSEYVAV